MGLSGEYSSIKTDYNDFLKEFKRVVEKLLFKNSIPIAFNISGRLKDLESIEEKLRSKRFSIKKSITELNDLVGLRIVVLFPEYKSKVQEILNSEFKSLQNSNLDLQKVDRFGYSSIHLILGIKEEWLNTPDWKDHSDKKIEVQIRTLSEHIWAETSHSLFYKREENIPKIITRDIYRLAALLEVVDEKMQNIKARVHEHFEYIKKCPYEEILTMDLNSETFRRVMLKNSDGIYNLDDTSNKIFSSLVEQDYNILNVDVLDSIIANKIDLSEIDSQSYLGKVVALLETNKAGN